MPTFLPHNAIYDNALHIVQTSANDSPLLLVIFQNLLDYNMASKISSALPSHLKPSGASNGDADGAFARKHHGKTQSHVVSDIVVISLDTFGLDVLGYSLKATWWNMGTKSMTPLGHFLRISYRTRTFLSIVVVVGEVGRSRRD